MKKGIVLQIHSVAGLLSGLFIILMSFSGAALVFHDELDSLQYPSFTVQSAMPVLSVDSCYRRLQERYPRAQVSNCTLSRKIEDPYLFTIYDSSYLQGKKSLQVFIHPQTGNLLKTRGGSKDIRHNFMSWLTTLHNSFHLEKKGEWLLGFFSIIFVLSLVTGTILYRNKIRGVLLMRNGIFRKKNVHQIIGVYALLFNLLIAVTGFWMQRYVFRKEFYTVQKSYSRAILPSAPLPFRISNALALVHEQHPGFTPYVIYFAQNNKGRTALYGSNVTNSFIHSKKFADVIFLDSTGRLAGTAFVNEIDRSSRYDIINSQVHFGKYGGLPVKVLYSVMGVTGGTLSITGFLLWFRRRSTRTYN